MESLPFVALAVDVAIAIVASIMFAYLLVRLAWYARPVPG
jgi:hypothetical protein